MPANAADFVQTAIETEVRHHAPRDLVGVCSLAVGADQMFADTVVRSGGSLHVVVPCARYDSSFEPEDLARYVALLGAASVVETLGFLEPSEGAFLAAGQRVVDLADTLLAVWDGEEAAGVGGTADVVDYARSTGVPVLVLWPDGVTR